MIAVIVTIRLYPRKIVVDGGRLILKCVFSSKIFEVSEIESISCMYNIAGIRRFGSNGFFGYVGVVDGEEMLHTFVNNRKNMVKFLYGGKWFVVSCDNPDELVDSLTGSER